MAFDVNDAPEPLDYDFDSIAKRYPGKYPDLEGVTGTTPEPSDDEVRELQAALGKATSALLPAGVNPDDRVALATALKDMDPAIFKQAEDGIIAAVAEITKGSPTFAQIMALPFRIRRRYVGWIQRELMNPEA